MVKWKYGRTFKKLSTQRGCHVFGGCISDLSRMECVSGPWLLKSAKRWIDEKTLLVMMMRLINTKWQHLKSWCQRLSSKETTCSRWYYTCIHSCCTQRRGHVCGRMSWSRDSESRGDVRRSCMQFRGSYWIISGEISLQGEGRSFITTFEVTSAAKT